MANPGLYLETRVLDSMIRTLPRELDAFLREVGMDMIGDMKLSFNTSPAGRQYRHGGVVHVASRPGYPPNKDTAALSNSLHLVRVGPAHYRISDGVKHGIIMELGAGRVLARPWMRPVFERYRKIVVDRARNRRLFHG